MEIIIAETNRVTTTGAKEYIVNDLFKFTIEPEDYGNGEITIDVKDQNVVKENLQVVNAVITRLKQKGLLTDSITTKSSFLDSIRNMSRPERRRAILDWEKRFGGKFEYISNY
jgi:hypothetical protein